MRFLHTVQTENSEKNILREIQNCDLLIYKNYTAGDVIMDYTVNNTDIGILLSGKAELICSEYDGKSYLLEQYASNDIFGYKCQAKNVHFRSFKNVQMCYSISSFIYSFNRYDFPTILTT